MPRTNPSAFPIALGLAVALGCGTSSNPAGFDAGPDGGHGQPDAGTSDGGPDAGIPDAGTDGGAPDAGPVVLSQDPLSTTDGSLGDHEPSVAASPDGHLVVSWLTYIQGGITVGYRISLDNGMTWGSATLLPFVTGNNVQGNASVAADPSGTLYLAWGAEMVDSQGNRSNQHVFVATAAPGALQFGTPVEVDDPTEMVGVYDQPHLALTANGTLNISYEKDSTNFATAYIVDATSTDGIHWTRTTIAGPGTSGSGRGFARICTPPAEGRIFAVYADSDLGMALSWSDDDGATWQSGTPTTVEDASELGTVLYGFVPSCVTDGTQVSVLYGLSQDASQETGTTEALISNLRLAHSSSAGVAIDAREDVEDAAAGQDFLKAELIAEPSGALDLAYYAGNCANDDDATLRVSRATDGTTFAASVIVRQPLVLETSRESPQWFGDYLGLTYAAGALDVVYTDNAGSAAVIGFFSTTAPGAIAPEGKPPDGGSNCSAADAGMILQLGSSCAVPQTVGAIDPCASAGLECTLLPSSSSAGSCQLPSEFSPCAMATGCVQTPVAWQCAGLPGNGNLCVQSCAVSTDCSDPGTNCQQISATVSYCLPDNCGPGVQPANGADFYGPCTISRGDDGFCFPFEVPTTNGGTGTSPLGYCAAVGAAGVGDPCQGYRTDAGVATLCAAGLSCTPDATGNTSCEPVCAINILPDEADGGTNLTCAANCAGYEVQADWGVCVTTCASPASCTTPETCQSLSLADGGVLAVCLP